MQAGQTAAAGGYGELALTALLVLVVVCVAVAVAARYAGRCLRGGRGDEGLIRVRGRVPLEPRRALYVIEVGGRTLLVGSSEGGISVLTEVDAGALPRDEGGGGFAALVTQALARRGRRGAMVAGASDARADEGGGAGAALT